MHAALLTSFAAAPPAAVGWLHEFRAFSILHLATVVVLASLIAGALAFGRSWRTTARERRLRTGWVGSVILWQAFATTWWLLPAQLDVQKSLPLHICDLVAWIAPFALITESRILRSLLYFWGLGLSTQAFITPVVTDGPLHMHFWLFWIGHTQIVGSAIYDIGVRRFRPTVVDFLIVTAANTLYMALIVPFNILTGANYGYLGDAVLEADTLLRVLGPWPGRVLWMWLIVQAVMTLMWLIWPTAARFARGRGDLATPVEAQNASSPL